MSAFMCTDEHIAAIAAFAYLHRDCMGSSFGPGDDPSSTFNLLWHANVQSLRERYPRDYGELVGTPEPPDARSLLTIALLRHKQGKISAASMLKSLHCYAYQACESERWARSDAKHTIDACEDIAIRSLPGYEAAAWGAPSVE